MNIIPSDSPVIAGAYDTGGNGQEVAKPANPPKSSGRLRDRLPRTHQDYWKSRLEHRCYTRSGKLIEVPEYSVRIQYRGQRDNFALTSTVAINAAMQARDIWVYLQANGWDATRAKFKPQVEAKNDLTIGDYLTAVQGTGKLRLRTFLNYANSLRTIVAGVLEIKDTWHIKPTAAKAIESIDAEAEQLKADKGKKAQERLNELAEERALWAKEKGNDKYDYKHGGVQRWRERIDVNRLEKLTPQAVEEWMRKFVSDAGASQVAIASARRTANSYVRCARSLFSNALLSEPGIAKLTLPDPLPFKGVKLFQSGSTKYISKINVQTLIAAARQELKTEDPEAYKVFLLGLFVGMRKAEIDLCEWRMLDWDRHVIKLEETEWLHLKTNDSAGEITVDAEVLAELRSFMRESESTFVIDSTVSWTIGKGKTRRQRIRVRQPRNDCGRAYYRCEPVFNRLNDWLRGKGVSANKPLHELRKEIGALISTEHGIFAAKTFLRHSDITTTARHYADHKTRITVGLGKYLKTSLRISKKAAA